MLAILGVPRFSNPKGSQYLTEDTWGDMPNETAAAAAAASPGKAEDKLHCNISRSMETPLWRRKSNTVWEKTARIEGAEGEGQEDSGMGQGHTHYRKIISYRYNCDCCHNPEFCSVYSDFYLPGISRAGDRSQSNTTWVTRPHSKRR